MSVDLRGANSDNGAGNYNIDVHNFKTMRTAQQWIQYGTFEVKTIEITTNSETIKLELFRDIKED